MSLDEVAMASQLVFIINLETVTFPEVLDALSMSVSLLQTLAVCNSKLPRELFFFSFSVMTA